MRQGPPPIRGRKATTAGGSSNRPAVYYQNIEHWLQEKNEWSSMKPFIFCKILIPPMLFFKNFNF
jgi:hypothetical protein